MIPRDKNIIIRNRNAQVTRLGERCNGYELGLQRIMEASSLREAKQIARHALAVARGETEQASA